MFWAECEESKMFLELELFWKLSYLVWEDLFHGVWKYCYNYLVLNSTPNACSTSITCNSASGLADGENEEGHCMSLQYRNVVSLFDLGSRVFLSFHFDMWLVVIYLAIIVKLIIQD